MLGALVIVLREVVEAGLIVGIILAATKDVPERGFWISLGIFGGLFGASVVAAFAGVISRAFEGSGQDLMNAAILIAATAMLTFHNVWMARHGAEMAREMRELGTGVASGEVSLIALSLVVGLAVLREGAEVVLFLAGIVASGTSGASLLTGGVLGLLGGAVIAALSYFGLLAIPTRRLFAVTSAILLFVAAGLAAQAVQYLSAADWLTVLDRPVWNSSAIVSDDGAVGRLLRVLLGYTARPTGAQLIAYLGTMLVTLVLMRVAAGSRPGPRIGSSQRKIEDAA